MTANSFVNEVLSRSIPEIEAIISGQLTKVVLKAWFNKPTGYESYRRRFYDKAIIRDTSGVLVVVKRAPHLRKGFLILTAYPINP
ncbi:hypothetical protein AMST5_00476 [freshwater sediment metagenome]|uniref:Bacterial CdiA-CT RNAse A domain-containing protein n=1 Tax=freshwater sediment metagenome TaxID=556182 RepID=A0AA48LZR5_9ZZZZ